MKILHVFIASCFILQSSVVWASSREQFYTINSFEKGQNSHISIFNTPKNQANEAKNVRVNKNYGSLSKREVLVQSEDYGSTAINSLYRYYKSDGTTKTLATTSTLVRSDFSGTPTTIRTNRVADGKRFQWVTYQDNAIGGNNTDLPIKYDGSTSNTANTDGHRTAGELCAELGAPYAELDSAGDGNDLDAASWYMYKVAHYDGTTYSYSTARSNPILTGTAATVIESCDTDAWDDRTGGSNTVTADGTIKKVGTHSSKNIVGDLGANVTLASEAITSTDITGYAYIHFWVYCSETQTAGDLQIGVSETADMGGTPTWVDIPAIGSATTWTRMSVAITTTALNAVISVGFRQVADEDGFTLYIDDVSMSVAALVHNIALTDIPLGPAGTTNRYIYRTLGGADQATVEADTTYYMVKNIADNSTQTLADSVHDDDADADTAPTWSTASAGTNATPPICPYWIIHNEHLFGAGNTTYYSQLYWSDEYNPDFFDPIDYEEIRPDDGDKITFIKNQGGILRIGKTNTIQNWYTNAASDKDWYVSDPLSYVGCPAPYSPANTPAGIFYLGWDGLYKFDGRNSQLVSDAVTDVIKDISRADIATTAGFYHESEYHLAYASDESGSAYNDKELIYDLTRDAYVVDTKTINCYAAFNAGTDTGILYMGSSTIDGWVFMYAVGSSSLIAKNKADIDTGTHNDTMSYEVTSNPHVTMEFLDKMEDYTTDTLAQAAWVSSDTAAIDSDSNLLMHVDSDYSDSVGTHTPTSSGASINTTYKKFGAGSVYLDGDDDYVTVPDHADWNFGTGDFTLDAWIYITALQGSTATVICDQHEAEEHAFSNGGWSWYLTDSSLTLIAYTAVGYISAGATWTPQINTWYHVATVRTGNNWMFFADGTQLGTTGTDADAMPDISDALVIGAHLYDITGISNEFYGYIDEFRVTKGLARWTADFSSQKNAYGNNTQSYSENSDSYVNDDEYSLYVETLKTHSSTDTLTKTITSIDLSASTHDDILIDVYADRTYDTGPAICTDGTGKILVTDEAHGLSTNDFITVSGTTDYNGTWKITKVNADTFTFVDTYTSGQTGVWKYGYITLGMSETAATYGDTNVIPICPAAANTWETITLNFAQLADASKNAIIELRLTVADATHDNMIYIDNIRPALTTATWSSATYQIDAFGGSLNKIYWNENLNTNGDITFQIRLDSDSDLTGISWNTAVSSPAGSDISGITANDYIEVRANFSTTDGEYHPWLYEADGYIFKLVYSATGTNYESTVPSVWKSGWTNLDVEGYKKFIKRLKILYHGTSGVLAFTITNEEGDIARTFNIDLSVEPDDDSDDAYTGVGTSKIYTWEPAINSETEPSPIGELWQFSLAESGVIVWDLDKVQVLHVVEELY